MARQKQKHIPGTIEPQKDLHAIKQKGYQKKKANTFEPPNLGKAIRLPVPDFGHPDRRPVCLEVDFPIAPVNALSNLEGNAGKPIYQMSKWWARRRSSVFRSLLIASAVEAPNDPTKAAKFVWDHYYSNHQRAGHFKRLRVLDPFMGGGTTLVEGARLGFQMVGVDLNPVAWFVTRNELAASDPEQVRALFEHIEAKVKPLVQPFYTTTCPRGHKGRWVDKKTGQVVEIDPINLTPEERKRYRWEGPEVIYTFWAKHGPCQARGCGHRSPIFRTPVIAEKKLTTYYIETTCPSCGHLFNIELGEMRIAPSVERIVLDNEPSFTETSQKFARLIKHYSKGRASEKRDRITKIYEMINDEPGLRCPKCGGFAGQIIKSVIEKHDRAKRVADIKKKDFGLKSRPIYMYLLIHPKWLEGASGHVEGEDSGGYVGADPGMTVQWFKSRLESLRLIEVRGRIRLENEQLVEDDNDLEEAEDIETGTDRKKYSLPRELVLQDGTVVLTRVGTVPRKSHFTCAVCGKQQDILEAVKSTGHTAPVAPYALQCHCPECQAEGYNYGGRYFKALDDYDLKRLEQAEREWAERREGDLKDFWPRSELWHAYMTHRLNGGIPNWGYTHWWKMFNPRQLLVV